VSEWFRQHLALPGDDAAPLAQLPAAWAVALLSDDADRPFQILAARDIRNLLRRRFEAGATAHRKVDYARLVRHIRFARVGSDFESDLVFRQAAREHFPERWHKLVIERAPTFVRVQTTPVPTLEIADSPGDQCFGPFESRSAAVDWIASVREAFDLCRYEDELRKSPAGRACMYKQMNKCAAPCDGTVSMSRYQQTFDAAVAAINDPTPRRRKLLSAMTELALEQQFESAAKLKDQIARFDRATESVKQCPAGFDFLAVLPAARRGSVKLWRVSPTTACEWITLLNPKEVDLDQLPPSPEPITHADDLLALMSRHMTLKKSVGRWIDWHDPLRPAKLRDAVAQIAARKSDGIGETRETQPVAT
jgi:excinuclease UvrABC nuclease subunit